MVFIYMLIPCSFGSGVRDEYRSPVDPDTYVHDYRKKYNRNYPDESENQEDEEQQVDNEEADEESYNEEPENHSDQQDEELNGEEDDKGEQQEQEDRDGYKYPGEPKKPNPPVRPNINVHYDGSVDFDHPPRDLPPPNKPKKKGRGPYGHPRHRAHQDAPSSYSELYRDAQKKSEEELLAEIEEESRRHRNGDSYPYDEVRPQEKYEVHPRMYPLDVEEYEHDDRHLPLKVYHQGQSYPLYPQYTNDEEVQYPLESQRTPPSKHNSYPVEDIRETKKGTREYVKLHKRPANHELEDLRSQQKKEKRPVVISCDTVIRRKPKTYQAYRVRPIYSHYRVVPYKLNRRRRLSVDLKRSHAAPKLVEDDSAYEVNSHLDNDYQKLRQKVKSSG